MSKSTKEATGNLAGDRSNSDVLQSRAQCQEPSPLDDLVRSGARKMLQEAIDAEVQAFLEKHADQRDEYGRRLVVGNGHKPPRTIVTGAGQLEVQQARVRDNTEDKEKRVKFSFSILPPYLRRSKSMDALIPWLYLKGISTGDFGEALLCDSRSSGRNARLGVVEI